MSDEDIKQALVDLAHITADLAMIAFYSYELSGALYEQLRSRDPELVAAALRPGIFGAGKALPQRDEMLQRIREIARRVDGPSGTRG